MKFPTIKEMAEEVAEKALDEYEYKGKTLRQWIEIIAAFELSTNLAEVGKNCISRQTALVAVKDALMAWSYMPEWRDEKILEAIAALPSAEPRTGKWIRDGHHIRCDQCGIYMCDTDREGDRIPTEFCPSCGAKMEVTT